MCSSDLLHGAEVRRVPIQTLSSVTGITQDADGRITYSVKDHQGRLLATKREGAGAGWDASTRYVYDEMDRLAAVVGAGIPVSDTLSMWR